MLQLVQLSHYIKQVNPPKFCLQHLVWGSHLSSLQIGTKCKTWLNSPGSPLRHGKVSGTRIGSIVWFITWEPFWMDIMLPGVQRVRVFHKLLIKCVKYTVPYSSDRLLRTALVLLRLLWRYSAANMTGATPHDTVAAEYVRVRSTL